MTARLSVRGKLDRPWDVPCTCGNRYAEHTDGSGCRVCACSRYRSIEAEATAAAEQRLRERIEALTDPTADRDIIEEPLVSRAAVLALLDTLAPRETPDSKEVADSSTSASPRQGEPVEGLTEERLRAAGFDPPENVCASCKHRGSAHDLGNWCLVCPRPAAPSGKFEARIAAGWCYFASMTDAERWAYGLNRAAALSEPTEAET